MISNWKTYFIRHRQVGSMKIYECVKEYMNNIQVVGKITIENNKIQDIQADTLEIKEYMLSILKKTGEIDDVYIKEQGI